jgi:hypothetical protein
MEESFFKKHHRLLFYGGWLLAGLLQSFFTELMDDEAYYWVYSRFPDWGYFDHPPMIALLIKAGYTLFQNELGVRLGTLLLNTGTLLLCERLLNNKQPFLFYTIAASVAVIQLMSFVAVPDTPLIFFTALFFLSYRNFTEKESWINVIALALAMSALMYSKYHGALVILLTLASNPKLLLRPKAWLAVVLSVGLFAPHLWWQYQHEWPSLRYHLVERNVKPYYQPKHTWNFLYSQLLLPGPFAGLLLIPAALLFRTRTSVEKALKYTLVGFYVFFFFNTFRGRVEANWTGPVLIALLVLGHQALLQRPNWQLWMRRLVLPTLLLVLAARVLLIFDLVPATYLQRNFHSWKKQAEQVQEQIGALPAVWPDSYQDASKYWFYTGKPALSLNTIRGRSNNFNYWPVEDSLLGKTVVWMNNGRFFKGKDSLLTKQGPIWYRTDSGFFSLLKVGLQPDRKEYTLQQHQPAFLRATVHTPLQYKPFLKQRDAQQLHLAVAYFNTEGFVNEELFSITPEQLLNETAWAIPLQTSLPKEDYYCILGLKYNNKPAVNNSGRIKLLIH